MSTEDVDEVTRILKNAVTRLLDKPEVQAATFMNKAEAEAGLAVISATMEAGVDAGHLNRVAMFRILIRGAEAMVVEYQAIYEQMVADEASAQ